MLGCDVQVNKSESFFIEFKNLLCSCCTQKIKTVEFTVLTSVK